MLNPVSLSQRRSSRARRARGVSRRRARPIDRGAHRVRIPDAAARLDAYRIILRRHAPGVALRSRSCTAGADRLRSRRRLWTYRSGRFSPRCAPGRDLGHGAVWISHDLRPSPRSRRVLGDVCGRIIEEGPTAPCCAPAPSYSRGLIDSLPSRVEPGPISTDPRLDALFAQLAEGCAFRPRCAKATEISHAAAARAPWCPRVRCTIVRWRRARERPRRSG